MNDETDIYLTINTTGTGEFKIKGSRFLAFAHHASTDEEVSNLLAHYRKTYYDAHHHCYAWMLGPEKKRFRTNDDGEPAGTAGKPILNQILSVGITDVLIVVVRYFGGTKLGTSGLITAYKSAAKEAISKAEVIYKTVDEPITAILPYSLLNDVMRVCKNEGVIPKLQYTPETIILNCPIRRSCAKKFSDKLASIYGVVIA
jgi:uncharacterized YigZ family protein